MTQFRVKKIFLFDPATAREQPDPGKFDFDKAYYVPQLRQAPPRYKWWIKLFGKNEGEWKSCAPIDVVEGLCIEHNKEGVLEKVSILDEKADRIHWFSRRQDCEAWIERLMAEQKPEFQYYPQQMNSTYL